MDFAEPHLRRSFGTAPFDDELPELITTSLLVLSDKPAGYLGVETFIVRRTWVEGTTLDFLARGCSGRPGALRLAEQDVR